MNKIRFVFAVLLAGCGLSAHADVVNVVARQRWPWSGVVDIDYLVTDAPTDVKVSAICQGQAEPVDITALVEGGICDNAIGDHHLTWDPTTVTDTALNGVSVTVTPVDGSSVRKYLVVDLMTGGFEFLSDVPSGGWTADHRCKKMVFRRIPAGTYTLGLSDVQMRTQWPDGGKPLYEQGVQYRNHAKQRTVRISNPYYMAVYQYTSAQDSAIKQNKSSSTEQPTYSTTTSLRGPMVEYDWPHTGHDVSPTNAIGLFRAKARLPKGWLIDLPTSCQFEIAARCGTTDPFPYTDDQALTPDLDATTLSNRISTLTWWAACQPKDYGFADNTKSAVGLKEPNPWGFYDIIGYRAQVVLDWYDANYVWPDVATDPVGPMQSSAETPSRVLKSIDTAPADQFAKLLPSRVGYTGVEKTSCFRLCIDTRSLIETTSDTIPTP